MKIQRKKRFAAEVSTASLNDIMFFLLLFFLIISTLANPNVIKIMLPRAKSTQVDTKQQLTLTITEDKNYFIDNRAVLFEELEQQLVAYAGKNAEPTVILRLAHTLTVQDMVDVMSICSRNKIRIVLAAQKVD